MQKSCQSVNAFGRYREKMRPTNNHMHAQTNCRTVDLRDGGFALISQLIKTESLLYSYRSPKTQENENLYVNSTFYSFKNVRYYKG